MQNKTKEKTKAIINILESIKKHPYKLNPYEIDFVYSIDPLNINRKQASRITAIYIRIS